MKNYQKILSVMLALILAFGALTAIPAAASDEVDALPGDYPASPDSTWDSATPDSTWDEWNPSSWDEWNPSSWEAVTIATVEADNCEISSSSKSSSLSASSPVFRPRDGPKSETVPAFDFNQFPS